MCSKAPDRKEPIDTSSRRSIKIRFPRDDQVIKDSDSHVVVDHFFHDATYWTAVVPLAALQTVFGQAFNFSKPKTRRGKNGPEIVYDKHGVPKRKIGALNHVQSRFVLESGQHVELYPLGSEASSTPSIRINDFVYSVEAVGPQGVTFNLRDGMSGTLVCAHRFLSTQEMVFERIVVEGQYVLESPALPLTDAEKRGLLTKSLMRSHDAAMTEPYYLYRCCGTNNCTSNPLQILDEVVGYSLLQRVGSALYRLPLSPRFYLRIRGLDSDPAVKKLMRTEFEDYIQAPETQSRKRAHVREQIRIRRAATKDKPQKRRRG